ncbi:hypothetical protein [Streptomyces dangxiongensis]|uniref:hypothetical protein n=1 Tax=Streptomyces dangxiongensis TaxID=1442032 RepID=UPI001F095C31|nr:hypothetical protein [Streptomyces dangxiongensis]
MGTVPDGIDGTGRNPREVAREDAPGIGIEVTPAAGGGRDVRLAFRRFRTRRPAGRGHRARGRLPLRRRRPGRPAAHPLAAALVPRGTQHVTARLYADDGTVWAVRGKPVESTADVTVSGAEADGVASAVETDGAEADGARADATATVEADMSEADAAKTDGVGTAEADAPPPPAGDAAPGAGG